MTSSVHGLHEPYIMLTPTAVSNNSSDSSLATEHQLVRKWAAGAKRHAFLKDKSDESKSEHDETVRVLSRTETDGSSEVGNNETGSFKRATSSRRGSEAGAKTNKDEGEEKEKGVESSNHISTYVCVLHDPKPVLVAEQIPCNRVSIKACESRTRVAGVKEIIVFRYEIAVGQTQQTFECSPSKALDVVKQLSKDESCADQLRFAETNFLRGGFMASLKRFYASPVDISMEVRDVLEAISDVVAVLMHPTYLELVGATKGSRLAREIARFVESHQTTLAADMPCMCDTYYKSVKRYGEFYREQTRTANQVRGSTVASDTLMRSRSVLTFYTDTIYILDKNKFRPTHGLKQCSVYGFGRRKLFEIVRVSRKQWSLHHIHYGEIFTLSLKKYGVHHMVAVRRCVPNVPNGGGLRQENVCFVKKSKRQGYRCLLMSEIISQGKVTTSIRIQQPTAPPGDSNFHYMTVSEVSGPSPASICSSTLSVPCGRYKYLQRLSVSRGSDVVTYIALAASYDILVGALTYWIERKY